MISIKLAEKEDLGTISVLDRIEAQNYFKKYEIQSDNEALQLTDSTQVWRNWIDNGNVFKALNEYENLVGVIVALSVKNRGYCIHKLLVSEELEVKYADKAVSILLVERLLLEVDKRENNVSVIVHPDDIEIIDTYSSLGFKKQIYQRNYLGVNKDRLIMSRPINWSDSNQKKKVLSLNNTRDEKQQVSSYQEKTDYSHESSSKTTSSRLDGGLFLKSMNSNNYGVGR